MGTMNSMRMPHLSPVFFPKNAVVLPAECIGGRRVVYVAGLSNTLTSICPSKSGIGSPSSFSITPSRESDLVTVENPVLGLRAVH